MELASRELASTGWEPKLVTSSALFSHNESICAVAVLGFRNCPVDRQIILAARKTPPFRAGM